MYVLMITPNEFPNGDAGSLRDESFAKIYRNLGYSPIVICKNRNEHKGNYNGIQFISLFRKADSITSKFTRFMQYSNDFKAILRDLECEIGKPSLIHLYDATPSTINFLKKYARLNNIQLIHDSVEWYSPCEFKLGRLDKAYILKNRLNKLEINEQFKVIAISSYLQKHFLSKGIESVRIPVVLDVQSENVSQYYGDKIKFIYAGSPVSKDHLVELIMAFCQLSAKEQAKVQFDIFGINQNQIYQLTGINVLPDLIKIHGRVSHNEIVSALMNSDFSVLLRPAEERYTKAGFPTKSVEAMSHGVAMMCNLTSDLDKYLVDGQNAIIIKDCTDKSAQISIKRILKMSRTEITTMKNNARKTAENCFDYRLYSDDIKNLISRINQDEE